VGAVCRIEEGLKLRIRSKKEKFAMKL
jgi:hypothetical protein